MNSETSKPLRVGIQGVRASFHDVAARNYFGERPIQLSEFASFRALAVSLEERSTDLAVMAIENSIAGSILPNYQLLEKHPFVILGEVYQRIVMNLMALPGQKLRDLDQVFSHPMALLQCEDFFLRHPHLKKIEAADTAESAKDIRTRGLLKCGAIASRLAADVYGLELLAEGIESDQQNYTRFLIIARRDAVPAWLAVDQDRVNKASFRLEISHRPGSLAAVLLAFERYGVNLTKLQSVPILGRPYQYSFHLDLEWENYVSYQQAIQGIAPLVVNMINLGEYISTWKNFP
jgi:prephenate dehydratase